METLHFCGAEAYTRKCRAQAGKIAEMTDPNLVKVTCLFFWQSENFNSQMHT
jgi:hypothetical protein